MYWLAITIGSFGHEHLLLQVALLDIATAGVASLASHTVNQLCSYAWMTQKLLETERYLKALGKLLLKRPRHKPLMGDIPMHPSLAAREVAASSLVPRPR